jgi:hypothetical protein
MDKHTMHDLSRQCGSEELWLQRWDHQPSELVSEEDVRLLEVNQPSAYAKLPDGKKTALQGWIREALLPSDAKGHYSSYGLKHAFADSDVGFYVTNGEFKGAMLVAGYGPINRHALNWMFGYRAIKAELWGRSFKDESPEVK